VDREGITDSALSQAIEKQRWPYRHPLQHAVIQGVGQFGQFIGSAPLRAATLLLPPRLRRWLKAKCTGQPFQPPVGSVRFGDLGRTTPISRNFGFDRGQPVDRFYIERFLADHAADIRGRVLEIGDNVYTRRFGGGRVTKSDVLHVQEGNPRATIVADLTAAGHVASESFDCVILVQTLQFIYDVRAALLTLHRILKPGGILLATLPGISQLGRDEWRGLWCWSFTTTSTRRLFGEVFGPGAVDVAAEGNVLAATAFLHGVAAGEIQRADLDYHDADYEMLITVRAVKPNHSTLRTQETP
jgi:SAM-dependent methyltransferase